MSVKIIADKQDIIDIANAVRERTSTTSGLGIKEIADKILSISGGNSSKNTKTVHLNWSMDSEMICAISYYSGGELVEAAYGTSSIEAENGIVIVNGAESDFDRSCLVYLGVTANNHLILMATQDSGTVYLVSNEQQGQ